MTSRQVLSPPGEAAAEEGDGIDRPERQESKPLATGAARASEAAPGHAAPPDVHAVPARSGAATPPPAGAGGHAVRASAGARLASLALRVLAGLLILGIAVVIAGVLVSNRREALQAPLEETVRRVRALEAVPRPAESVSRMWEGYGTARAMDRADVAAEVGGRIVERPARIDPGVAVAAGETLVRIDEADYRERMEAARSAAVAVSAQIESIDVEQVRLREQVEQAQEQVELTQWELDRLQEARAGAAGTELDIMRLRAQLSRLQSERSRLQQQLDVMPSRRAALLAEVAALQNEAAVAERQLQRTRIVSPIAGILQNINAQVGEVVQAGQPVARVVDLERIEVPLRLPASAQGDVRIGDVATIRSGAAAGSDARTWQARVARIAPEADPQTRTITVFLEVQQQAPITGEGGNAAPGDWSELLMPGRFVSAELASRAGNGGMLVVVPRRAVVNDRVWVAVRDDQGVMRAQPRQVRVRYHIDSRFPDLDSTETQWAVIGSGVQSGDQIIVTNLDDLSPGVRVEVVGESVESVEEGS